MLHNVHMYTYPISTDTHTHKPTHAECPPGYSLTIMVRISHNVWDVLRLSDAQAPFASAHRASALVCDILALPGQHNRRTHITNTHAEQNTKRNTCVRVTRVACAHVDQFNDIYIMRWRWKQWWSSSSSSVSAFCALFAQSQIVDAASNVRT